MNELTMSALAMLTVSSFLICFLFMVVGSVCDLDLLVTISGFCMLCIAFFVTGGIFIVSLLYLCGFR